MNGLYAATMLVCAHLAVEAPDELVAAGKMYLHDHPAIVRMWERNGALREQVGLVPHRLSPELTKAAQDHAWYMARTGDFSHYSNYGPSGRASKYGYQGGVTENIAMGQGDIMAAFAAWQSSGAHWANLTGGTIDAGFGYAVSASGTPYWVAMYGNPPRR
jgi:uncharacterized protein YkwD